MKIGILGCGNWGSVFGIIQLEKGHQVKIWEFNKERALQVQKTRDNRPFLVGCKMPSTIVIDWAIENVIGDVDVVVFAIPSHTLSAVVENLAQKKINHRFYLSLVKGIDVRTLRRPSEIISQIPGARNKIYVLSGPCIANEIMRREPTAAVLVGTDQAGVRELQQELTNGTLRIYQGDDMIGVELAAALKNVIALACGISDGLGFGNNAKGALITRGIVEIQRLGVAMGAQAKTFWGLSGLGDLVTTSFSHESRNHQLGVKIGKGEDTQAALAQMVMVAEGVPTAKSVKTLAKKHHIDMPICELVYEIIFEGKSPKQGIKDLMARPLKHE